MAISAPLYTVEDLDEFPRDGNRYELLGGVLLVTPAPSLSHQMIAGRIQLRLSMAVMLPSLATVVGPGAVVQLPRTQLEPDILVFPWGILPGAHWREVEEHWLAVEVLSPSSRVYDREFKRDAYLALGVRQVWLIDLSDRSVEVCRGVGESEIVRDVLRWQVPGTATHVSLELDEIFAGL